MSPDILAGAELRRRVGPVAWCALEVLVARSHPTPDGVVADASVRSVAAELGVATNTAQRALQRLRAAGLIEHSQRRLVGGRFDRASYRLDLPADILVTEAPLTSQLQIHRAESKSLSSKRRPNVGQQLVLLPS